MSLTKNGQVKLLEEARADLVKRLRAQYLEIEAVIFARVRTVSEPAGGEDDEYIVGLRAAVAGALDYGLMAIEQGEEWMEAIPLAVAAQARRAARNGVGLETVLLRYVAGYRLLGGFVMAESDHFPSQVLRQALEVQGSLLERFMAVISTEYKLEVERAGRSLDQRRGERVQRLLAGESVDLAEFDYEFDGWHLGVILIGASARKAVQRLETTFGRQLLSVSRDENVVWAWLAGKSRSEADIDRLFRGYRAVGLSVAIGEPGRGIHGWRFTHHQAQAALMVAQRRPQRVTVYAEEMLLAAALRDETLRRSLEEMYLSPLANQRDGGVASRETLRRYFDARSNGATAAVTLGVDRHTVERRLHAIEKKLGRLLHTCQPELEVALHLHDLSSAADGENASPAS